MPEFTRTASTPASSTRWHRRGCRRRRGSTPPPINPPHVPVGGAGGGGEIRGADVRGGGGRVGAMEPGKWADIVAVDGDPLGDVRTLENVKFVMKGGQVYKNEYLNESAVLAKPQRR